MSTIALKETLEIPSAGMSEIIFLERGEEAKAVVGSCIALTLYHPRIHMGALAHIVLPAANGRIGAPGKFADTAIPHMLKTLNMKGCSQSGLVAKMCGGASMFGGKGPIQVGLENAKAVAESLKALNIPVRGKSVGGPKGRKISFECETGSLSVEAAGEALIQL